LYTVRYSNIPSGCTDEFFDVEDELELNDAVEEEEDEEEEDPF